MNTTPPPVLEEWKPLDPTEGPWLIWSRYWSRWHRRSPEGHAAGYTDDIAHAGVFDEKMARAYHDPPPHRRDEAVPLSHVADKMEARLGQMTAERDALAERIHAMRAKLAESPHV